MGGFLGPCRSTGSGTDGITEGEHAALRQLIHLADGGGPFEGFGGGFKQVYGGVFPSSIIWYESAAKSKKVFEKQIVRDSRQYPTQITWIMYDTDGSSILAYFTDVITYDGIVEETRTRTAL